MIERPLAAVIRLATGIQCQPMSTLPRGPVVYFANHTSHLDFLSIWAALPPALRRMTHPVAAKDYWTKNAARRWLASSVFRAHLIDRIAPSRKNHPLEPLFKLLTEGYSLIIFPEGTRSRDGSMKSFKPGIHHIARRHPEAPLVPICLENMNRILPAGELLPIPLLGRIDFRPPISLRPGESKADFLIRAQHSVQPREEIEPTTE